MLKSEMPLLRPIPIKTKGLSFFKRNYTWITSIREWEIAEDWNYILPDGTEIVIPKGFVFDGASVPRLAWGILSPTGILFIPGLIHDHGYRKGFLYGKNKIKIFENYTRKDYDNLFFEVCEEVNGMNFLSKTSKWLLSLFGFIAWNNNLKKRTPK